MENDFFRREEIRERPWEVFGDPVLQNLATGEKRPIDVLRGVKEVSPDSKIDTSSLFKCLSFMVGSKLVEMRVEAVPDTRFQISYFRLTDTGAVRAFQRGLISEEDMIQIVDHRSQNPYDNQQ